MSDHHDAITTPPRRRVDHHHHHNHHLLSARPQHHHTHHQPQHKSSGGDSCKNTPNLSRKIDAYHQNALFDGGSQSAKSSPLPHRRLDKLEGCIRDKPSPLSLRRRLESLDDTAHSTRSGCSCRGSDGGGDLEPQFRRNTTTTTTAGCDGRSSLVDTFRDSPLMRRRLDSDCGCAVRPGPEQQSPQVLRRHVVMGEPGCFSSPVHQPRSHNNDSATGFVDGPMKLATKCVLGEPGVFASPARSISSVVSTIGDSDMCTDLESLADDSTDGLVQQTPDQTVVSGWLKFRDNKRVRQIQFSKLRN